MTFRWLDGEREDFEAVRAMFREYRRELGVDLCFQGFEAELAGLPGRYAAPSGGLLVVESGSAPAACGALRDLGDGVAEIKRVYVRPPFRRRGLAREMSIRLSDRARIAGYGRVRLDTLRRLAGASALYESLGFAETSPYNFNPEPDIVYYEMSLVSG